MAVRIDGKAVAAKVRGEIAEEVAALKKQGVQTGMAVVLVGEDPASKIYVRNKGKVCAETISQDRQTQGILAFNEMVAADPRVENVILPLRDGLNIIYKK